MWKLFEGTVCCFCRRRHKRFVCVFYLTATPNNIGVLCFSQNLFHCSVLDLGQSSNQFKKKFNCFFFLQSNKQKKRRIVPKTLWTSLGRENYFKIYLKTAFKRLGSKEVKNTIFACIRGTADADPRGSARTKIQIRAKIRAADPRTKISLKLFFWTVTVWYLWWLYNLMIINSFYAFNN